MPTRWKGLASARVSCGTRLGRATDEWVSVPERYRGQGMPTEGVEGILVPCGEKELSGSVLRLPPPVTATEQPVTAS